LANDNEKYFKKVINSLKDCIFGEDKYKGEIYWIDNDKRAKVMDHLLFTPKEVYPEEKIQYTTEKTLLSRYSDIDKYILSSLPLVSIDRHFSENVYYVTSENYEGGQLAAKELLERGAKQLAYIGGTNIHENETVLRKAGFYDYAAKQAEILQEPVILGPQLGDNGQFYFRVSITVQSGTQSTVYHQFYRLYHDALLKGGIDLPTIYTLA